MPGSRRAALRRRKVATGRVLISLDRSSPRAPHLSDLQGSSILERLVEAEVEAVLSLLAHAVVEAEVRARLSHDEQAESARHRRIPVPEARVVPQDSTDVRITHGMDVYSGDYAQPLPDGESELRFTVEERFPDMAALDVAPAGALVGIAAVRGELEVRHVPEGERPIRPEREHQPRRELMVGPQIEVRVVPGGAAPEPGREEGVVEVRDDPARRVDRAIAGVPDEG